MTHGCRRAGSAMTATAALLAGVLTAFAPSEAGAVAGGSRDHPNDWVYGYWIAWNPVRLTCVGG
jgi:hypothetical protein